jgi:hypothetical protein
MPVVTKKNNITKEKFRLFLRYTVEQPNCKAAAVPRNRIGQIELTKIVPLESIRSPFKSYGPKKPDLATRKKYRLVGPIWSVFPTCPNFIDHSG